jgi:flavin reductase (DIM6/NTAB) family NADH-FMN oxidoreductase RutF
VNTSGEPGDGFNALVGELNYPMFIATTRSSSGELAGCLVGFASQCSIDPPRFLLCLSRANRTCRVALDATAIAVHFVPARAERLAELFGGQTGDRVDKFALCDWREGPESLPILAECDNWFVGRVLACHDLGDHVGFVLDPVEAHPGANQTDLEFHRARQIDAGHDA